MDLDHPEIMQINRLEDSCIPRMHVQHARGVSSCGFSCRQCNETRLMHHCHGTFETRESGFLGALNGFQCNVC